MAIRSRQSLLGKRSWRPSLSLFFLVTLLIGSTSAAPKENEAESWRRNQLKDTAQKIEQTDSDDERLEYVARQTWLRRWKPGQMPLAPTDSPIESELVEEPLLEQLEKPNGVSAEVWQQMISSQTDLLAMDTVDDRKENLRTVIGMAGQLEKRLSDQLPLNLQQLPTPTAWVLAYTRYRLGRALAYRELPIVRERWPISNPVLYEEQLSAAYQRLIDQTNQVRPEFILLEDRMLRRSGKKGQALELLEANRRSIEPKWYLKKRRDLLQELGWEPPYKEAAKLYRQAGYSTEP